MFPINNTETSGELNKPAPLTESRQLEEPCEDFDQISTLDVHDNDFEDLETLEMYSACNMCPSCDEEFLTEQLLNEHMSQSHPELFIAGQNHPTDNQTKKNDDDAKEEDIIPNESDAWQCNICQKNFKYRNSLAYHLRSHSGERPFRCEMCGKRFFTNSALKVHQRQHSGEKPYTCQDCGRSFRQPGDLKYHRTSIHSGELSFQCEFCEKKFARKYSLVVHRRIHTGDRSYKCDVCMKTFRAACYLNSHRKIHTGEKPHNCDLCGKAFRMRSDLKRHFQAHERNVKIAEITITPLEIVENENFTLGPEGNIEQINTTFIPDSPAVGGSLTIGGQNGTILGEVTLHPSENVIVLEENRFPLNIVIRDDDPRW